MRTVIAWQQTLLRNIRPYINATFSRRGRDRGHHQDCFSSVYNKRRRIGVPRLVLPINDGSHEYRGQQLRDWSW